MTNRLAHPVRGFFFIQNSPRVLNAVLSLGKTRDINIPSVLTYFGSNSAHNGV